MVPEDPSRLLLQRPPAPARRGPDIPPRRLVLDSAILSPTPLAGDIV